jgi:FKBP-type peptidyl-prolyl cis-trans isomerase
MISEYPPANLALAIAGRARPNPGMEYRCMPRFAALLATVMACLVLSPALAADTSLSQQVNAAFLAANAKKPGVIIRPSGLQYRIIRNGFGKRPGALDSVDVYYKGSLINGTVFDQTEPGLPANFVVNKLVPGWTEALEIMKEGDHWELVIPAGLAYGSRGAGGGVIPPDQTLVFDLELVKVMPPPKDEGQDQNSQ